MILSWAKAGHFSDIWEKIVLPVLIVYILLISCLGWVAVSPSLIIHSHYAILHISGVFPFFFNTNIVLLISSSLCPCLCADFKVKYKLLKAQ